MFRRQWLAGLLAGAMLLGSAAVVRADDRDFKFSNTTGHDVTELYVESSDQEAWGPDILGDAVLPNGKSANVTFNGYKPGVCEYDIKVVFVDGSSLEAYKFDLCTISEVELADDGVFYYR